MPTPILMPALSPTMEEGTLAKWLVKEGDTIAAGDVIAEIETDKATMEVEAVDEGTVGKIIVEEGTAGVKVNAPIAVLLGDGESAADIDSAAASAPPATAASAGNTGDVSQPAPQSPPAQTAPTPQANGAANGARIMASPLARRMAEAEGLDLAAINGSGPNGRVVKRDIELALKSGTGKAKAAPGAAPTATPEAPVHKGGLPATRPQPPALPTGMTADQIRAMYEDGSFEELPHDGMRKTIAKRLMESKLTIPHFYLTRDIELDALLALRADLNGRAPKEGPGAYKLSVNDFIIKALALALIKVPDANVTWTDEAMLKHKHADVGVAVAIEGGLFTPVIKRAEGKGLSTISNEMKDLAGRARTKKLAPQEYQGGVTAVSNLGMYGIREFAAVINPPHATILAVGAGEKRVVVREGEPAVATCMSVTLSCDHRAVDGALGAQLLEAFKGYIEDPMSMML